MREKRPLWDADPGSCSGVAEKSPLPLPRVRRQHLPRPLGHCLLRGNNREEGEETTRPLPTLSPLDL